jgi:SAM-dependent methyltransferase
MRLLDCGCGPGTTTVSLAEFLAPGEVVGIDIGEHPIELAKAHAAEREVTNVRFEVGNIYELPFPDDTFDAAFAHTVLQHVSDPVAALKEMRRVLKHGGVAGIREEDWGSHLLFPPIPLVEEGYELYMKYWQHNGGDPYLPRRYREILRKAGFTKTVITASAVAQATPEAARWWGYITSNHLLEPIFIDTVTEQGWVSREKVEELAKAMADWGEQPDAFRSIIEGEGVAWKE